MWLKLDNLFFGLEKDIYLCVAYMPPQNSSSQSGVVNEEKYDDLRKELDVYTTLGNVAIFGDFNSRIGSEQVRHISIDTAENAPDITRVDQVPPRNSRKRMLIPTAAISGNYLLIMIWWSQMAEFVWIYMCGNYTCMQYNGCSLVDMLSTDSGLFNRIDYLKVFAFDWYSDYAAVSPSWSVDIILTTDIHNNWQKLVKLFKNWDKDTKQQLLYKLSSPENSPRLNEFYYTDFHSSHPATCELTCTSILNNVLKSIFRKRVKSKSQARNSRKRDHVYKGEIQMAKWILKQTQRAFANNPDNMNRRQNYISEKDVLRNSYTKRKNKIKNVYSTNSLIW